MNRNVKAARQRILRGLNKAISEQEQLLRDMLHWNNHRTEHPPFDCEPVRVAIDLGKKCREHVTEGTAVPDELWFRLMDALREPIA